MNVTELFLVQAQLDERIKREHNLSGSQLLDKKILALLVELGELANETRCFKFWSKKGPAQSNIILEEYVDALHFLLSIGLEIEADTSFIVDNGKLVSSTTSEEKFLKLYADIPKLQGDRSFQHYDALFHCFLQLGDSLGFTLSDIETSYYKKNEINHKRQDEGY
jgi:dimeric dUTPase (all-alpha-NTP-PPase superfamily)